MASISPKDPYTPASFDMDLSRINHAFDELNKPDQEGITVYTSGSKKADNFKKAINSATHAKAHSLVEVIQGLTGRLYKLNLSNREFKNEAAQLHPTLEKSLNELEKNIAKLKEDRKLEGGHSKKISAKMEKFFKHLGKKEKTEEFKEETEAFESLSQAIKDTRERINQATFRPL